MLQNFHGWSNEANFKESKFLIQQIFKNILCAKYSPFFIKQGVCNKMGPKLSTSCEKVEKAIYELLTLILPEGEEDLQAVLKLDETSSGKSTPKIMSLAMLSPVEEEEEEELRPGDLTRQRQEQKKKELHEEAKYLLEHYSKQMLSALIKCTKHTLELIKRRVTSPSAIQYGDAAEDKKKLDHRPAIKVSLVLSIPHVGLRPALEEVQTGLNTIVQTILAVHKGILTWGQPRPSLGEPSGVLAAQSKVLTASKVLAVPSTGALGAISGTFSRQKSVDTSSFFKFVSEHKEIAKLVSLMSSTISSAKVLVTKALEHFKQYEELWTVNSSEFMTKFMEENPSLSDFEAKMKEYTALDDVINEDEEMLHCGALALTTGQERS